MANYVVTTVSNTGDDATVAGDLAAEMADGGGLSLREAVQLANANASAGADTITFDGSTGGAFETLGFTVVASPLTLASDITIDGDTDGDGIANVAISGAGLGRVVEIVSGQAILSSLRLGSGQSFEDGGTVRVGDGAHLTITGTTISGGTAAAGGGIASAGTLTVTGSTIFGAIAERGGALYSTGTTTLVNTPITTSHAEVAGAVYVEAGTTRIVNTTITGNSAEDTASAVYSEDGSTLTVANSLITGNGLAATAGENLVTEGAATVTSSIVFEPSSPDEFVFAAMQPIGGGMGLGGVLADNGGPVSTVALRADLDNPALDAGDDGLAPATDARGEMRLDQRGAAGNGASVSDLGAFELTEPLHFPEIADFGGSVTVVEDDPANSRIDADVVIGHGDHDGRNGGLGDYRGATLLIERDGGAVIRGEFGIDLDGASFTQRGNFLFDADGNAFATVETDTNRLLVRFTSHDAAATSALVTEVAQRFTFENLLETEDTALTARLTFTDDMGRTDAETVAVTVVATDDAPVFVRPDLQVVHTREGTIDFGFYGISVAAAGDVDGDGVADVIVGGDGNVAGEGIAEVLSGADGSVIRRFTTQERLDRFGSAVAGVGDVDGDGFADLAVGAYGGASNQGVVRVYSGADGSILHTLTGTGNQFGRQLAGLGDVDGDGFADFAVSAPRSSGAVTVFSGATGETLFNVASNLDQFGAAIAGPGDLDGDGVPDLLVGSPFAGLVAAYSGADGGLLYEARVTGASLLGGSVAGTGDIDGDGVPDFVVGSAAASPGEAYVLSGKDGAVIHTFRVLPGSDEFGHHVTGVGDVNADGIPDIAVAALRFGNRADPVFVSEALVFSGADGVLLFTLTGREGDGGSPVVAGLGDLNGDGFGDLAFGVASSASTDGRGRVDIYQSGGDVISTIDGTAVFTERGAPVVLDELVEVFDLETEATRARPDAYESQTLTLSRQGGANPDDKFTFAPMPNITVGFDGLFLGNARIADYESADGTLTVTFTSRGGIVPDSAILGEVFSAIQYENASASPPAGIVIEWTFGRGSATTSEISTVMITQFDDPGTAADDVFTILEDNTLSGNLFADNGNGADTDSDSPLAIAAVNGHAQDVGTPVVLASGAALIVEADGSFDYTPPAGFAGPDGFTYTLADGDRARVDITVEAPPPVAIDDRVSGARDGAILGDVGLNDLFTDDGAPVFDLETNPEFGTVVLGPDGTFVYIPLARWFGSDTFSYTITDAFGREDTADVTVDVAGPDGLTTGPVTFDTGDRPFTSRFSTFDATGERVASTIAFDDGRIVEHAFSGEFRISRTSTDIADAFIWHEIADAYDSNGVLEIRTRVLDDGRLIEIHFELGLRSSAVVTDVADVRPWSRVDYEYDENGDLLTRTVTPDEMLVG